MQLVYSQEAIPVSGGEAIGFWGPDSYTVNQAFYTTNIATFDAVSQGMQHSFEFKICNNFWLKNLNLTAVTYPNPTEDIILLKIKDHALHNLRYTFFDANGGSIASDVVAISSAQIQMKDLCKGMYVLKVSKKNKSLKSLKIF
jgi:hypothetical protein